MKSALIPSADFDGSGHGRRALAIGGEIGAATAKWFRDRLDEGHLARGDAILLTSAGGELDQAIIMGELIRSRGLVTVVGVADASGQVRRAHCASACVLVYAGGKVRYGVEGSMLGVHQFEATTPLRNPGRYPAHRRDPVELYDEDGRVLRRRRSDVSNKGHPLAGSQGGRGDESRHGARPDTLSQTR